jgi:hypothetical protein
MSVNNWMKRLVGGVTDDPIREGKLVRGRLSTADYQASSDDNRAVFVVGAVDMFNQMIRYSLPVERRKLALMSEYATPANSGELRDMFDQYLAVDPVRGAGIYAANAFLIFLSEEARKKAGR